MAVAGPLVTLAIAAVCFGVGSALSSPDTVLDGSRFEIAELSGTVAVLGYLATVNVFVLALQPDPRLPARRRPDRARDRLEADRRPQPRHPLRRPARPRRGW